jgi:hypothetical protein
MKPIVRSICWSVAWLSVAFATHAHAASAGACDRACLRSLLDQYLSAVLAHDPAKAPLAAGFRQTENAAAVARGKGVWKSLTGRGKLQRFYMDPVNQSAGFYGTLREGEDGVIVTLRVQVSDRRISEAEWIIARKDTGTPRADGPGSTSVEGAELSPPPEASLARDKRASRAELMALANGYFDSLQADDTSLFAAHPGWVRTENGIGTGEGAAGMGRGAGAGPYRGRSGGGGGGPAVDEVNAARGRGAGGAAAAPAAVPACGGICAVVARRYPVVDEEAGVVLGLVIFQRPPGNLNRRNLLSEWFAVDSGKVRGIYASMHYLAPTMPAPNWPPYEGNWPLSFAPPAAAPAP